MTYNYPIIIVHKGNQEYLHICLKQAHYSNPNSRIILLGDELNENCLPFVEWYNIEDYFETAKEFEKIYQHFSINNYAYNLICIQRHYVLTDFVKKHGIEPFFHMDSDILLYSDLSEEKEYMENLLKYDFSISGSSPHSAFFKTVNVLENFCNYVSNHYKDEKFMSQIKDDYNAGREQSYLNWPLKTNMVQDMTWLYWFIRESEFKFFDNTEIIGNTQLNNNMDDSIFVKCGNLIQTNFINKKPYTVLLKEPRLIRMHTLHFQGWKKELMSKYCTYDKDENWRHPNFSIEDLEKIYGFNAISIARKREKIALYKRILNFFLFIIPSSKLRKKIRYKYYD